MTPRWKSASAFPPFAAFSIHRDASSSSLRGTPAPLSQSTAIWNCAAGWFPPAAFANQTAAFLTLSAWPTPWR